MSKRSKKVTDDDVRARIKAIAVAATPEERALAEEIIARAISITELSCGVYTLPAPTSAILFDEHNPYNREWKVKGCLEYDRRFRGGLWKVNGASIGFYVNGVVSDGQHRLSGAALSGHTLKVVIAFGIQPDTIDTVDEPIARRASDHARLEGVVDARPKQAIIRLAGRYFHGAALLFDNLVSPAETKVAMQRHNSMLTEALEIGECTSRAVGSGPLFKTPQAAATAFILLKSGAPGDRIKEHLDLFLAGRRSDEGEITPYYTAAKVIADSRDKKHKDIDAVQEIGVAIQTFFEVEDGATTVRPRALLNAVKGRLPNPTWTYSDSRSKAAE
jgi:hypothetical protein